MNRKFFILMMMTALLAAVFTSCKKDEEGEKDKTPPAWYTDAKTNFKNGRFVPEIEDIVPGSILGTNTSSAAGASSVQSSSAKSSGISAKSFEECDALPFSEIRSVNVFIEFLDGLSTVRDMRLQFKNSMLETFEGCELTEQNVWVSDGSQRRVKYTEDANGKYIYMTQDESEWGRFLVGGKLSMKSDGTNEIYMFESDKDGNMVRRECTYLKGDKYICVGSGMKMNSEGELTEDDGTYNLMAFDTKNGKKKGKNSSFNKNDNDNIYKQYTIWDFEGDNADYVNHYIYDIDFINDGTTYSLHQQAFSIINGIVCPYNGYDLDIKAFANIDEIYSKNDRVQGIKLTDGSEIETNPNFFDFRRPTTYIDGISYPWKPGDGFSILLRLELPYIIPYEGEAKATLSDCIPEELRPYLQLSNGFEELYAKLKKANAGYFDNYYIAEFSPIAIIKVNGANIGAIVDAISAYVQLQHEGF